MEEKERDIDLLQPLLAETDDLKSNSSSDRKLGQGDFKTLAAVVSSGDAKELHTLLKKGINPSLYKIKTASALELSLRQLSIWVNQCLEALPQNFSLYPHLLEKDQICVLPDNTHPKHLKTSNCYFLWLIDTESKFVSNFRLQQLYYVEKNGSYTQLKDFNKQAFTDLMVNLISKEGDVFNCESELTKKELMNLIKLISVNQLHVLGKFLTAADKTFATAISVFSESTRDLLAKTRQSFKCLHYLLEAGACEESEISRREIKEKKNISQLIAVDDMFLESSRQQGLAKLAAAMSPVETELNSTDAFIKRLREKNNEIMISVDSLITRGSTPSAEPLSLPTSAPVIPPPRISTLIPSLEELCFEKLERMDLSTISPEAMRKITAIAPHLGRNWQIQSDIARIKKHMSDCDEFYLSLLNYGFSRVKNRIAFIAMIILLGITFVICGGKYHNAPMNIIGICLMISAVISPWVCFARDESSFEFFCGYKKNLVEKLPQKFRRQREKLLADLESAGFSADSPNVHILPTELFDILAAIKTPGLSVGNLLTHINELKQVLVSIHDFQLQQFFIILKNPNTLVTVLPLTAAVSQSQQLAQELKGKKQRSSPFWSSVLLSPDSKHLQNVNMQETTEEGDRLALLASDSNYSIV